MASARSPLGLHFAILDNGTPVAGLPVAGKPQHLEAEVSDTIREPSFQFVSPNGTARDVLQLEPGGGSGGRRKYSGDVTPPNADYRLAATGTDAKGFPFQRVMSAYFVVPR